MSTNKSVYSAKDEPVDIDALQKHIKTLKAEIQRDLDKSKAIKEALDITDEDLEKGIDYNDLNEVEKELFSKASDDIKVKQSQNPSKPSSGPAPSARSKNIKRV